MRDARVTLFFFERDVEFCLQIGELRQLEEIRLQSLKRLVASIDPDEASLGRIYQRLGTATALLDDIQQVLRLGMVGAGMDKQEAFDLVSRHLVAGQILECNRIAQAALGIALAGPEDERVGETTGTPPPADVPVAPTGRESTARVRRSATPRAKSTS